MEIETMEVNALKTIQGHIPWKVFASVYTFLFKTNTENRNEKRQKTEKKIND